jgi:8-oxo-dGTP pyrophosphatase MutT (NUDIX family)
MQAPQIRVLVICAFWHKGRILVSEAHDPSKGQNFFRPLGGGVQFGETSAHALARELREEIGAEIANLRCIGTIENIFTYLGEPGHEIVQVYDGTFLDRSLYGLASIPGVESNGRPFRAVWRELQSFTPEAPLYPAGLEELLKSKEESFANAT